MYAYTTYFVVSAVIFVLESMLDVIYATRCALFWDATRPLLSNVIE